MMLKGGCMMPGCNTHFASLYLDDADRAWMVSIKQLAEDCSSPQLHVWDVMAFTTICMS
jgi:hypothetical protein